MKSLSKAGLVPLALIVALAGCKATTTGNQVTAEPDAIFQAPEYATLHLETLGYLGLASLVPDPVGVPITEALLKSYIMGGQQKLLVVDEGNCRVRARKEGVEDEFDKVVRVWRDKHTVDPIVLRGLVRRIGIDGIIVGELTQWRTEQVDWQSEGNSFTEVGVALLIYEGANGTLAWKGEKMERRESPHYRHGEGVGSGIYQSGGVERTERGDKIAPAPPDPQRVAESVVKVLIESLPETPGAKLENGAAH
jgi:hypothetical protein